MNALDRILDSLVRRYERRTKECDVALTGMLAYRRKHGCDDRGLLQNYHEAHGRAEEARLAMNHALTVDAETRAS